MHKSPPLQRTSGLCEMQASQNVRHPNCLLRDSDVRVGEVDAELVNVVQALLDVYAGLRLAPDQIQGLEFDPWSVFRRQIIPGAIRREAEDAAASSKSMNLHGQPPRMRTAEQSPRKARIAARTALFMFARLVGLTGGAQIDNSTISGNTAAVGPSGGGSATYSRRPAQNAASGSALIGRLRHGRLRGPVDASNF